MVFIYPEFMGNSDAPKAPAGWYPIEEGQQGERYWDGDSWNGKTRGVPSEKLDVDQILSGLFLDRSTHHIDEIWVGDDL